MSAQKVHRMKLKKAAAATAHMPLARRDKKVAKGMDEGEASVSLLAHNSSLPAADNAVSTADNAAHHHHQQQQQQQQQQQPSKQGDSSKPGKRGIRNVFGFGKNKNKSKKQLGYTLTQTPKTVKGTSNAAAISPVQVQTQKNYTKANTADKSSSPTGITPKAAKLSPFHKATSPKKANNQATEMDAVGFDAEWNPSFYDDNLMGESEKESTAKLPQSSDDEEEVSAAPSIEMTYHTSDTPHQMESHAEVTVSTSLSATSPKSSKSHLLENKTPKSTTSASENSAKSLQSKSSGRFISPRKSSSSAMPKSKSPGARAAARAIVEDYDDFGANDFDPNDSSSDEEETDTMNTTTSTGPFASQGDGDSSAFQFDLAAGSMKSRSPQSVKSSLTPAASIASSKKSNKSVAAAKAPSSPSDGGFQILMTRSSRSKGEDTYTPKQSTTQTTVASSTSMLSSLSIGKKGPSSSPSSRAISPSSNKKSAKSSQQSPSGSSILSHQTSTSSSLFPSSSNAANTPTSVVSGRSSRKRRGNGNDKSQLTSVTSATSPMSEDDDLSSALRMGSTSTSLSLASGSLSPNSTKRQQAKLVLSRAFGRHSLPPDLQPWKVEISPAEWDGRERRWKYRIQVQRQETTATASPQGEKRSPSKGSPSTMSHFTWRSLDNFVWLEQALNAEFQGALLLPLLNIAVGMTDLEQVTHEVDANLLKDWLSDILNGVRGQGKNS